MICNHLDALSTYLHLDSTTYEKALILGDCKVAIEEQHTKIFAITTILKPYQTAHMLQISKQSYMYWFDSV